MYCTHCGGRLQDDTDFCPACGRATGAPAAATSSQPVVTLRPVFISRVTLVSLIPLHLFLTVWGGGFFGGFALFGVRAVGWDIPVWSTFAFFSILFFVGVPGLAYVAQKKTYAKTEYRFYDTRLDYHEGFFTTEEKTIDYRNVTEANLVKGVVQRRYGLGTIVLSTPATAVTGRSRSAIRVQDVSDPDRAYERIKGLIARAARQRAA